MVSGSVPAKSVAGGASIVASGWVGGLWTGLVGLVSKFATLMMVIGPITGYLPQYIEIMRNKSAEGFSTRVCLILLSCNILRVYFWLGKHFDVILLYQAFMMLIAQFFLLEICVRYREGRGGHPIGTIGAAKLSSAHKPKTFRGSSADFLGHNFWAWDDFMSYVYVCGIFVVSAGFVTFLFINQAWYVEALGYLANGIEAVLGFPQMMTNHKRKSTEGLSVLLIVGWFLGDGFKTIYFVATGAPIQFVMCGVTQIVVDSIILWQIRTYSRAENFSGWVRSLFTSKPERVAV